MSHERVHTVTDRASLLAVHRMFGRPIRAKVQAFYHNMGTIFCQFTFIIQFLLFDLVIVQTRMRNFEKLLRLFCLPIRNTVPRIFEHVPPCRRKFSRGVCPILVIFTVVPAEIRIRTICCVVQEFSQWVCIPVECILSKRDQEIMLAPQCPRLSSIFFHMRAKFCFFPATFMSSMWTDKNKCCFLWASKHPNLVLFPNQVPSFFRTVFPTSLASGCPYKFRSRGTTGSSMCSHDFGHLCFGRRVHTSEH